MFNWFFGLFVKKKEDTGSEQLAPLVQKMAEPIKEEKLPEVKAETTAVNTKPAPALVKVAPAPSKKPRKPKVGEVAAKSAKAADKTTAASSTKKRTFKKRNAK